MQEQSGDGVDSEPAAPVVGALEDFQRLRVLLVEDEDFSARVMQVFCTKCDYTVQTVRSSEEALEQLAADKERPAAERFNLILLDIVMKGMSGKELLRRLHELQGPDDQVCVVMVSSPSQREMVEECLRSGAESYLVKPVRTDDLEARIPPHISAYLRISPTSRGPRSGRRAPVSRPVPKTRLRLYSAVFSGVQLHSVPLVSMRCSEYAARHRTPALRLA